MRITARSTASYHSSRALVATEKVDKGQEVEDESTHCQAPVTEVVDMDNIVLTCIGQPTVHT